MGKGKEGECIYLLTRSENTLSNQKSIYRDYANSSGEKVKINDSFLFLYTIHCNHNNNQRIC